ncbi:protein decapping 5 [Quercus suber]|uniref:Protein decapping 5 n=1 Tax=Quercus suber TaxID=58331 RepID=A0AAW0KJC1_QUESU
MASAAATTAEAPRSSSGSADSYIGSLISLTSKSEIRYEGVLFNINTDESSIGLRNVRSFGTEGRKKDGPQVLPSDKVYEYILFRGSDIKDLQVKSSPPPPVQTTPIHHDPAIIQSHYPQAATASTSLPPPGAGSIPDLNAHTSQMGLPRPTFQGSLPLYQPSGTLYQPSGSLGSWGSSPPPPTTNVTGLAMPMYWQGYYGSPNGFQAQQQSLLRPPPGLSMAPSMQQTMQYPVMSASLPSGSSNLSASSLSESTSPLLPPLSGGILNLQSSILPAPSSAIVSDSSSLITNKAPTQSLSTATLSTSLPLVSPLTTVLDKTAILSSVPDKPKTVPSPVMPFISVFFISAFTNAQRDVEVVQVLSPELSQSTAEVQEPILPLPLPSEQKLRGAPTYHYTNRGGRERGRGNGISRPVTRFTEEFDFTAMNEKFNKDEVWGDLGKSNKAQEDAENLEDEDNGGETNNEAKPVYVKDDFFDSLSCDALDRGSRNGRTKFSEQLRKDSETFGYMPRHWGNRGGRGAGRGGRSRGGYYGRGYGNVGRGRGYIYSSRDT